MSVPSQTPPAESRPQSDQGPVMGHHYDGIREYDNPMPGWWIWIFWVTVIFAPIYVLGVHVFGFFDTYEDDLAQGQAELAQMRADYEAANPSASFDLTSLQTYADDPSAVEAGRGIFSTNCMPCHGAAGEGGIGPNLTDDYSIHGNQLTDLFTVVTNGVLEKGMTPWESILSPEQRAQVVAFVRSLHGTNPPNAKPPQGELVES